MAFWCYSVVEKCRGIKAFYSVCLSPYHEASRRQIEQDAFLMTKQQYIDLTGEDPEDMFGPDWKNIIEELNDSHNK